MSLTTICFDFGNTRVKCGVFIEGELTEIIQIPNGDVNQIKEITDRYKPDCTILSSVINHDEEIESFLAKETYFIKLNSSTKLPFSSPVNKPATIGADRLALSAFAVHTYPQQNTLIIALGSCITYNFINKYNQFLGGSISPGLEMRFKSLHALTAKLPLIQIAQGKDWHFPLIGYDTETNILSGVVLGMAAEIDGIVDAYEEKYEKFNVLLTGGDTHNFVQHLKNKIFADPYLILKGLYAISQYNHENKL